MADKYSSFAELAKDKRRGQDYKIIVVDRGSHVAIIAPHAGKIESHCSMLATTIAGLDMSLYLFEGTPQQDNRDLHITSASSASYPMFIF